MWVSIGSTTCASLPENAWSQFQSDFKEFYQAEEQIVDWKHETENLKISRQKLKSGKKIKNFWTQVQNWEIRFQTVFR